MRRQLPGTASREGGFALILAILTLVLLTTLGLSLSSNTSTELQISMNHRWTEQARYNAEAGIEVGKRVLAAYAQPTWAALLPAARVTTWDSNQTSFSSTYPSASPAFNTTLDSFGLPIRNFEGFKCDTLDNGVGYGAVLNTGSGTPYQFVSNIEGYLLSGAFTLWIRRPTALDLDNATTARDYAGDDALVLVSEGVAPYTGEMMSSALARRGASTAIVEVVLRRAGGGSAGTTTTDCGARQGQVGGGAQNAGFGGCVALTGGASLIAALPPGSTSAGSGNLK